MESDPLLIFIFILTGAVIFLTILFSRRRKHIWKVFARRHGLRFHQDHAPEVRGQIDGRRQFHLYQSPRSSDTGLMGVEEITMALSLLGSVPKDLQVFRGGWIKKLEEMLEDVNHIPTGDEQFDRQVAVMGRDPEAVRKYLTPARKEVLVELVSSAESGKAGMRGPEIFIREREMLASLEHLEGRFQSLLNLAPHLDEPATGDALLTRD